MTTREQLNTLLSQHKFCASTLEREKAEYIKVQDNLTYAEEAQQIIQSVAVAIQEEAHNKIASVVSRCLEAVFNEPYEFRINFERKRGRTEAVLAFVRGNMMLEDPLNEAGGGVIDLSAFALRLACLVLERPTRRRLLVLDEPFGRIRGAQNRERVKSLIESLANDFQLQIIMCLDLDVYPDFALGNVVEVE